MKKIIALLLSVSILFAFTPTIAMAGDGSNITKEEMRSQIADYVEMYCTMSFEDEDNYCQAVWSEIEKAYNDLLKEIGQAKDLSQYGLYDSVWGYVSSTSLDRRVELIAIIAEFNKDKVSSVSDFAKVKKNLTAELVDYLKSVSKSNYSDYYWNKLQVLKTKIDTKISNAKKILDIAAVIQMFRIAFPVEYYDVVYEDEIDVNFMSTKKTSAGINTVEDYLISGDYSTGIYKKSELKDIANEALAFADSCVSKLSKKGTERRTKATKIYNTYSKKMFAAIDAMEIVSLQRQCVYELMQLAGSDANIMSEGDKLRYVNRLEKMFKQYNKKNYSEDNWYNLVDAYDVAVAQVYDAIFVCEVSNSIVANTKKKLDAIQTYDKELASTKATYIKKLKLIASHKKYDKKKVQKALSKGIAAINACKKIEDVKSTYNKYAMEIKRNCLKKGKK